MEDKNIIDAMEIAMMDRITEKLAKNEEYQQSVEKEGKVFDWLRANLEGEASKKLEEYFNAASSTAYYTQKLSYLQGMKDLYAFNEYLDEKPDNR